MWGVLKNNGFARVEALCVLWYNLMNRITNMKKLLKSVILTGICILALLASVSVVNAAAITWEGDESALWSTDGNWNGGTAPGASDVATFDGTGNTPCTIDASIDVKGIDINSGYNETITQAAEATIGSSHYNQADGVFTGTGSSATIDLNGNFTLSAGTFTATSGIMDVSGSWTHTAGGTFNHNSGTVVASGNGKTFNFGAVPGGGLFYNFTVDTGGSGNWFYLGAEDTLITEGTLTLEEGFLNNSNMYFNPQGDFVIGSDLGAMNSPVTLSGIAADQSITDSGGGTFGASITINKSSGTATLYSDVNRSSASFVLTDGGLDANGYDFSMSTYTGNGGTFVGGTGTVSLSSNFVLAGGIFNAASGTMSVAGNLTHDAGGTFNHNNGLVYITKNGVAVDFDSSLETSGTFYDVVIDTGGTGNWFNFVDSADIVVAENDLNLVRGFFNDAGFFQVGGDLTIGNMGASIVPVTVNGSGDQDIDATDQTSDMNADITVNKSGGVASLVSDLTVNGSDQDLTIEEGTFDLNGYDLDINDAAGNNLTVEDGGIFAWEGTETLAVNSGEPSLETGSTVQYNPSSGTVTIQDWDYHHLESASTGTGVIQMGATETFGNLTITSGVFSLNGQTLTATGTVSNDGTFRLKGDETVTFTNDSDSGIVEYVGDGDASADTYYILNEDYYSLKVNFTDSADVLSNSYLASDNTVDDDFWLYWDFEDGSGATVTDQSGNNRDGTITNSANEWVTGCTSLQFTNSYAVQLDGDNDYVNFDSDDTFVDRSYSFWFKGSDVTTHQMLFEEGGTTNGVNAYVTGGTLYFGSWGSGINNNWINGSVSADTWTNVIFVYDSDGDIELFINGTSQGTAVAGGDMPSHTDADAVGNCNSATLLHDAGGCGDTNAFGGQVDDFRIYERTLTANEISTLSSGDNDNTVYAELNSLNVGGDLTVSGGTMTAPVAINLTGSFDSISGTFTSGTGMVTFDGSSGTINSNEAFYDVAIDSGGTYTLDANFDIDGGLTIANGTLDVADGSNYSVNVAGNWSNSGTFTPREGAVTFDGSGTGTVSGSTTFYDLACTTAGKELRFDNTATQTVSGTLTLTGADGNLLLLRSNSSGNQWSLNVSGTSSVDYVDVKDSDASSGNAITHATSSDRSTDAGNNLGWSFNEDPTVSTVTAVQSADGTHQVTVSFIGDDPDDDDTLQYRVEYDVGSGWVKATMLEASGTSSTYGSFNAENDNTYQLGNANGYVTSSSGANTVTAIWDAASDVTSQNLSTAQIRITPYDGVAVGTVAISSNFIFDQISPSGGLTTLTGTSVGDTSLTVGWPVITTESNFSKYEIYYRLSSATSYTEYAEVTDMSAASLSVTGLALGETYNFYVQGLDDYGNSVISPVMTIQLTNSANPYFGAITGGGASVSGWYSVVIDGGGVWGDETSSETTSETTDSVVDGGKETEIADSSHEAAEEEEETTMQGVEIAIQVGEDLEEAVEEFVDVWEEHVETQLGGHWAEPYLKDFYETTLINEISEAETTEAQVVSYLFDPDQEMTRVEFLQSAMDLLGVESAYSVTQVPFSDMDTDSDGVEYVISAYNIGVIDGYPDGTFRPDREINRAEALKIIFLLAHDDPEILTGEELLDYYDLPSNPFLDVDIGAWYAPYIMCAYTNGIVSGYGDGYFRPEQQITLGEMAKIITLVIEFES